MAEETPSEDELTEEQLALLPEGEKESHSEMKQEIKTKTRAKYTRGNRFVPGIQEEPIAVTSHKSAHKVASERPKLVLEQANSFDSNSGVARRLQSSTPAGEGEFNGLRLIARKYAAPPFMRAVPSHQMPQRMSIAPFHVRIKSLEGAGIGSVVSYYGNWGGKKDVPAGELCPLQKRGSDFANAAIGMSPPIAIMPEPGSGPAYDELLDKARVWYETMVSETLVRMRTEATTGQAGGA